MFPRKVEKSAPSSNCLNRWNVPQNDSRTIKMVSTQRQKHLRRRDEWSKRRETKQRGKRKTKARTSGGERKNEGEESKEKEVLQGVGEGVSFDGARPRSGERILRSSLFVLLSSPKTHPNFHPRSTPGQLDAQRWPPSWLGGHRVPR